MAISRLCIIPLRALVLAALCATTATAMPANPNSLFRRQDTCAANDLVGCPSALPSSFCCPQGSSCTALAGGTTAMCCPEGSSCNRIKPITCNVREQDADENPDAPIKTTIFDVDLEKCGDDTCCPFGYTCSGSGNECIRDQDQSKRPDGAGSTASTTAAPSATSTGSPSSTGSAVSTSAPTSSSVPGKGVDSDNDSDEDNSGPATTSIIGGVVGGCVVLLIIAIVIFLYVRRKNGRHGIKSEKNGQMLRAGSHRPRPTSSTGSFGNIISDPIMQPNSYRTDFILKGSPSAVSQASVPQRDLSTRSRAPAQAPPPPHIRISIPNPFDSPNPSPVAPASAQPSPGEDDRPPRTGTVTAARLPPIRSMKAQQSHWSRHPSTPELQREPSYESINVFADPFTVDSRDKDLGRRLTHGTTFTEMMEEAELEGVGRGRPFVPGTTPRI